MKNYLKILHYSLGFPPYRTGGLTKYSIDLMEEEFNQGHQVLLLWPGQIKSYNENPIIKKRKSQNNIQSFEIINPLPVSLMGGIKDFDAYMKQCDKSTYYEFLKSQKPDVIHLHTLMGLHIEFLQAAKDLNIKVVFTTHDYFGLCPKVTFLYKSKICFELLDSDYCQCLNCEECNKNALSLNKVKLLQSPIYRLVKNTNLVKKSRRKFNSNIQANELEYSEENALSTDQIENYKKLRTYYFNMFEKIDKFHFNSTNTENIYKKFLNIKNSSVISITHSDIKNNIVEKNFKDTLKITYLGQVSEYKGFFLLKEVLDEIYLEGYSNFSLNISSIPPVVEPYMNVIGGYSYDDLHQIFKATDILVVPSLWKETFSFVTVEALSYGVPVLISDNVGAKDIVEDKKSGFIINMDKDELKEVILKIYKSRGILTNMNRYIIEHYNPLLIEEHTKQILNFYAN
ncbi:MAG: glycosyltransferase [Intestinibacter sp.]